MALGLGFQGFWVFWGDEGPFFFFVLGFLGSSGA